MFDDFREVLGDAVCVNCQNEEFPPVPGKDWSLAKSVAWRGIRGRLDRQIADTTDLYMSKVHE
jgi:hypothetical protein